MCLHYDRRGDVLANCAFPGREPLAAVPAFTAAHELASPARSGVKDAKMPAPAPSAAKTAVIIRAQVIRFHARFLR
jgi:hypothetical protein